MAKYRVSVEVEADDTLDAAEAAADILAEGCEFDAVELTPDGEMFSLEAFDAKMIRIAEDATKRGITTVILVYEPCRIGEMSNSRFTFRGDPITAIGMTQVALNKFSDDSASDFVPEHTRGDDGVY